MDKKSSDLEEKVSDQPKKKVVVASSEYSMYGFIKQMLNAQGYEVVHARDRDKLVEILTKEKGNLAACIANPESAMEERKELTKARQIYKRLKDLRGKIDQKEIDKIEREYNKAKKDELSLEAIKLIADGHKLNLVLCGSPNYRKRKQAVVRDAKSNDRYFNMERLLSSEDMRTKLTNVLFEPFEPRGRNNVGILLMGTTGSAKSTYAWYTAKELGKDAKVCDRATDRYIREEEKKRGGIKPISKKERYLYRFELEGDEFAIPETACTDLEEFDVFLESSVYEQKGEIIKAFPKELREKIVPILIYTSPERAKQGLEQRLGAAETLKRSEIVEKQDKKFLEHAHEFDFIAYNGVPIIKNKAAMLQALHDYVHKKIIPVRNFLVAGHSKEDYVPLCLEKLFGNRYKSLEKLERAVNNSKTGVGFDLDEDIMRSAEELSPEVAKILKKSVRVKQIKKAHGRLTLVLDEYKDWKERNGIIKYLEAQLGMSARYINKDSNYRRFSSFGLLKASYRTGEDIRAEGTETEGLHDGAVFSLTDFAGNLLGTDAPCYALNIAFLKRAHKDKEISLDPISSEEYKEKQQGLSISELNRGIETK
ncbi:hypothetical protein ACFLZ7_01335 [Nanoarchaeota archaeon]